MTSSAEDFAIRNEPGAYARDDGPGPVIEETAWGYIIRESGASNALRLVGSVTGRFVGAIMLMAAAGLWLMPDALYGAEVFGFKVAAMVMFSVFGGWLVWAGRHAVHPEFRIDTKHREIRIGQRGQGGAFRQTARVDFESVSSVFLLRSKEHSRTRLYLRLADLHTGIEVTAGNNLRMEILKQRLTDDLSSQPRQPARRQPVRPRRVAAA